MKEQHFSFPYKVYNSVEELDLADQELVKNSISAAEKAYAPYSNFHVGAALKLSNGELITGSNQENAAYPSGLCAERVALNMAGHLYPGVSADVLVISAITQGALFAAPLSPCGACRQVISEFVKRTGQSFRMILVGADQIFMLENVMSLLPFHFE